MFKVKNKDMRTTQFRTINTLLFSAANIAYTGKH